MSSRRPEIPRIVMPAGGAGDEHAGVGDGAGLAGGSSSARGEVAGWRAVAGVGLLLAVCVLGLALAVRNGGVSGRAELQQASVLTPQQIQMLDKAGDKADQAFQDHVSRQIKGLMKRAKREEADADEEDQKGLELDSKAKRTCKIADYMENTNDGLEKRARTQREAATSLEGRAAVLTGEANKEQQVFEALHKKGTQLRAAGQKLLTVGTELVSQAHALNATAHPHKEATISKDGDRKEDKGGEIVTKARKILDQANQHKANADILRANADKTSKAADAVLALGEKFERRAVSHRLKTMTYRSKCTMMKAKAEAALRKAQDEAQNARTLHKIIKPAQVKAGSA